MAAEPSHPHWQLPLPKVELMVLETLMQELEPWLAMEMGSDVLGPLVAGMLLEAAIGPMVEAHQQSDHCSCCHCCRTRCTTVATVADVAD